jgi:hypothetical protein
MTITPAPPSPIRTRAVMNSPTDVENAHAAERTPKERQRDEKDLLVAVAVSQKTGREHRGGQHEEVTPRRTTGGRTPRRAAPWTEWVGPR